MRRCKNALANLETDHRTGDVGEGVARAILGRELVTAESHVALDRANHCAIFAARIADRADFAVALDGQMRFHLDSALAHRDRAVGRDCDYAREQRFAGLGRGDNPRRASFHRGDKAIGGAQVDSENSRHLQAAFEFSSARSTSRIKVRI